MTQNINQSLGRAVKMLGRNVCLLVDYYIKKAQLDISRGQMYVFLCIAETPGTTQKEITKKIFEEKSAVAKAVKKLNALNYIEVERQNDDKRFQKIYLTARGHKKHRLVLKTLERLSDALKLNLDEAEISAFFNLLSQINENVLKELDKYTRRIALEQIKNKRLNRGQRKKDFIPAHAANDIWHAGHGDF